MFDKIFNVAAEAMSANRLRVNTIASNIANAQTTRTAEGGPYKRRDVVFAAKDVPGLKFDTALDEASLKTVRVANVVEDTKPPRRVFDPSNPDAKEDGYVEMPNVNPVSEMVNLISASQAYRAASEIANITKTMADALKRLAARI